MAIKAHVNNKPIEVTNYRVSEDATPLDPGSMEGGYGEITLSGLNHEDDIFLRDEVVNLHDYQRGRTSGNVTEIDVRKPEVTITGDSVLGMLNSWHRIPTVIGTFADLIQTWFDAAGVTAPVEYEDGIGDRPIMSMAHNDNLWDRFKLLLSAQQVEASLVDNVVVFREPRKFEAYTNREIESGWFVGRGETAKYVEVAWYETKHFENTEFYPASRGSDDIPIMQVDSTEQVEYAIQLDATLYYLPEGDIPPVDEVPNMPTTFSTYSVVGNDDLPIPAQMWLDHGGRLWVEQDPDDPHTVLVHILGAALFDLSPFRIAMSSGAGVYYNSLRLVGSGVTYVEHMTTLTTGASTSTTGSDIGITVQNPYITSPGMALNAGIKTAAAYSGLQAEMQGQALNINRRNEHEYVITLGSINREFIRLGIETIEDFNDTYQGLTLGEVNEVFDVLAEQFAVQAFGNAAGARILEGDSYYRITRADFGIDTMDYSAVADTTISDFNEVWEGATLGDFNDQWEGKTLGDFAVAPLRRN